MQVVRISLKPHEESTERHVGGPFHGNEIETAISTTSIITLGKETAMTNPSNYSPLTNNTAGIHSVVTPTLSTPH